MSELEDLLAEIEQLIRSVKVGEAESQMSSLINTVGVTELKVWDSDIRAVIALFFPKRQRKLTNLLNGRIEDRPPEIRIRLRSEVFEPLPTSTTPGENLIEDLQSRLEDLSNYHIFQWNTFYRDALSTFFDSYVSRPAPAGELRGDAARIRAAIVTHAKDIFNKGFRYVSLRESSDSATVKALSGLQRFLDLPVESYSTRSAQPMGQPEALRLRALTSAMLMGILEGFSCVHYAEQDGATLLTVNTRTWAHVLAFLSAPDANDLRGVLSSDALSDGICVAMPPFAAALDDLLSESREYSPIPTLSQFVPNARRLDIMLRTPGTDAGGQPVEMQCYFDRNFVTDAAISEAVSRNIAVLITPMRPDLKSLVSGDTAVDEVLVLLLEHDFDHDSIRRRILGLLIKAIYRDRSPSTATQPILYNFAREFPLNNPFLTRYYHVHRPSVRNLLRTFERRNGVRLWCSVRRSSKTTAGLDLGTSSGESNVISQTCDDTGQIPNGAVVYSRICDAIASGSQLRPDFLVTLIEEASSPGEASSQQRTVLVLDEYETLFGQLSSAAHFDPRLRYTVVQPLLNQMVAFTRDNLLIFMGQQPTAHYILMDQNQLSAYVGQDLFPLFSAGGNGQANEFDELLTRILTSRVNFDQSLSKRIFVETAGHPFLTANLLAEFVDWLIKSKRPANALVLTAGDFAEFARTRLRKSYLSTASEYRFFLAAISQALGMPARASSPWLHAMYSTLRSIALNSPETFSCSRG